MSLAEDERDKWSCLRALPPVVPALSSVGVVVVATLGATAELGVVAVVEAASESSLSVVRASRRSWISCCGSELKGTPVFVPLPLPLVLPEAPPPTTLLPPILFMRILSSPGIRRKWNYRPVALQATSFAHISNTTKIIKNTKSQQLTISWHKIPFQCHVKVNAKALLCDFGKKLRIPAGCRC